jgi:hypothetical protein
MERPAPAAARQLKWSAPIRFTPELYPALPRFRKRRWNRAHLRLGAVIYNH